MVFEKTLRRELYASAGGVLVTLLTILITTTLVRILGQAAAGKVGVDSVALVIGFSVINSLPMMLVLTVFVSVLLVVSRMYRDSEMVVWFASGVPLTGFIRPILRFAFPFALLVLVVAMVVAPWAIQQRNDLSARFDQRDDVARVSAGQFMESSASNRVFFVENLDEARRTVDNVFASINEGGKEVVVLASSGELEVAESGERYVVLRKGRRYEGTPGQADYSVMEFERYAIRTEPTDVALLPQGTAAGTMGALQVLTTATPKARGELVWRLGVTLLALILPVLAIPLAFLNPRAGRSANLILAILIFVIYNSLLNLSQARVGADHWSFATGSWGVHAIFAGLALLMFVQRYSAARLNVFALRTWRVWLGSRT
jgi:lipopolysaccharide export system permease protein